MHSCLFLRFTLFWQDAAVWLPCADIRKAAAEKDKDILAVQEFLVFACEIRHAEEGRSIAIFVALGSCGGIGVLLAHRAHFVKWKCRNIRLILFYFLPRVGTEGDDELIDGGVKSYGQHVARYLRQSNGGLLMNQKRCERRRWVDVS